MAATGNGGAWSYAVPLEETDGNARPAAPGADTAHWDGTIEKPSAKNVQRRSSAWDLLSDSETAKQRRSSMRQSNTTAGRKRSKNQLRDASGKRPPDERPPERVDDSAWIHRDKLAQIEIQEMEEAGFYRHSSRRSESEGPARHRTSRSMSRPRRSASRTDQKRQHEIDTDEDYAAAYPGNEESPRKRVSTVPSAPEEDQEASHGAQQEPTYAMRDFDPYRDSQFHAAEAITAQLNAQRQQQQTLVRPGTSRIPVSRVSPVPVSSQAVDRESQLPRSRAGSQNWGGSFDEMQYARKVRSGSMSSQVLLDSDIDHQRITPPGSSNKNSSNEGTSPPKSQIPKKTVSGGRTASAASGAPSRPGSSHQNKRGTSTSGARRPGSSSGHKSRPSAGYPPDGDAPWISSMYKPDPRLPPDQQMLPTHAKRMMQEQWEKDGKTGTAYDREFNLLNDDEFPKPPVLSLDSRSLVPPHGSLSPTKDKSSPNGSANGGPWPLSPTKSDNRSDAGSVRPGTSGGYKITPTIPDTPNIQRSPLPSPAAQMPAHNPTPRVPELSEKDEAAPKKGCCCIVM